MNDDPRCCGSGTCIIDTEGRCWCGQQWDGRSMGPALPVLPEGPGQPGDDYPPVDDVDASTTRPWATSSSMRAMTTLPLTE